MLGWAEIILILAVFLLIFGPDKLPKMARELGKAVQEFKKASSGLTEAVAAPERNRTTRKDGVSIRDRIQITEIAKKLDIETNGKMTEQITKEIINKIETQQKTADKVIEG